MVNSLNWIGLVALTLGFSCFGLLGFKHSAWWGPAKGSMEKLDSIEKRFVKIGFILLFVALGIFLFANAFS